MDDLGSPVAYLGLPRGVPVYSSDGEEIGTVDHVLADEELDIFDGLVVSARGGGHRFADARDVAELYERGCVLKCDREGAQRLPEPTDNAPALEATPDDTADSDLSRKLRRAWDWISGNY
jgi:uncharacterized protein YrrD